MHTIVPDQYHSTDTSVNTTPVKYGLEHSMQAVRLFATEKQINKRLEKK